MFFDAQNTPVYKKKIKKFEAMEPNESRRVWCHVTSALKEGNEQAAGDAKHEVSFQECMSGVVGWKVLSGVVGWKVLSGVVG